MKQITVATAYERASKIFNLLSEGMLSPELAQFRLDEVNLASGLTIRSDLAYLREIKQKHQKTAVFEAMKDEDEDYESSEYESSEC